MQCGREGGWGAAGGLGVGEGSHSVGVVSDRQRYRMAEKDTNFFYSYLAHLCLRNLIHGTVALTTGSVPRRIDPKLRRFHWLLKMNNQ